MEIKYKLLQTRPETKYAFMSYDFAKKHNFNLNDYKEVYSNTIKVGDKSDYGAVAEILFMIFNSNNRPNDYTGRSMSVSDILIMDNNDIYYCDDIGFRKVE